MKKLLITGILGVVLGTSAFAGGIEYIGQLDKTLSVQAKHIDIKDSGLDTSWIYGISYIGNKDIGEQGAWGIRTGFEFDYGKLDYSNKSGDTTYTEFSWQIAPSYTFSCGARVYAGGKVGYVGFSDSIGSNSGTNGYVLAGIVGAKYPVAKHFAIGAQAEFGNTYIDSNSYSTTTFAGYVGYRF